ERGREYVNEETTRLASVGTGATGSAEASSGLTVDGERSVLLTASPRSQVMGMWGGYVDAKIGPAAVRDTRLPASWQPPVAAVITFKRGTTALNGALVMLAKDLSTPVPRPPVRELGDIADGIAVLARSLALAREGEERLGRELERQERLAALGRVVAGVAHEV